jgi:hypothetical protein
LEHNIVWCWNLDNSVSFEMWCWRRMETIRWTDRVRTWEVPYRVKKERNILHTTKRRKTNWIGHSLRRNCLLKHIIKREIGGGTEVTGRQRRRCKQPLDSVKKRQRNCKLKEGVLYCPSWRARFWRGSRF